MKPRTHDGDNADNNNGAVFHMKDLHWQVSNDFALSVKDLSLPLGRTSLLLGPSASGKSTLLRLLGRVEGQYFPAAVASGATGELWLRPTADADPINLVGLDERSLLKKRIRGCQIGVVFQREGLFVDRSAQDNVAWPLRTHGMIDADAKARALELLEQVQLSPGRAVATLSGGERKRLALARALGPKPPVLLLDEPFTGLDPRALDDLLTLTERLIADADGSLSVVMVTHQREDIERLGQFVVFLRDGQLVQAGSRSEMAEALNDFVTGTVEKA